VPHHLGREALVLFGQARFSLQLRIAVTACIALLAWEQLAESLSFSFAWRDMAEYAGLGAWAVLAAAWNPAGAWLGVGRSR